MVPLSDRAISTEIIDARRVGDRDAFRTLYGLCKDRAYSIALYFFHGDRGIAADITQQVFLKLIGNVAQFRGDSEFSTWLYRLVVNVCLDAARHCKAEPPLAPGAKLEALAGPASQEQDFARAQAADSVRKAVSALPAKFRIAILLRYFEVSPMAKWRGRSARSRCRPRRGQTAGGLVVCWACSAVWR